MNEALILFTDFPLALCPGPGSNYTEPAASWGFFRQLPSHRAYLQNAIHTDHLGTPRKITRPSDNVLMWRWDPDTFGSLPPNTNPSGLGTLSYNLRFPGQYSLNESGLYYNYFRDYDPSMGRYIESDPIGLHFVPNTYAHVSNNPLGNADFFGLDPAPIGQGYTARMDQFNYAGKSSFEIHVFSPEGDGIGVYGPQGGIAKHGFSGRPPGLPTQVENSCKGMAVDHLRASGEIPPKGLFNIKGTNG